MRTAHRIATKLDRYTSLVMLSAWLNFGRILSVNFLRIFFCKILNLFYPVDHFIFHIIWLVLLMWNKKEISQLEAMLTKVPLTLTFDLEFSRWNCISGMGGPIVMKGKVWESIGFPHVKHYGNVLTGCCTDWGTFDLDILPLNFEGKIVSWEREAQLSWNEKGW